jgi:Fe-S oxidoreductase
LENRGEQRRIGLLASLDARLAVGTRESLHQGGERMRALAKKAVKSFDSAFEACCGAAGTFGCENPAQRSEAGRRIGRRPLRPVAKESLLINVQLSAHKGRVRKSAGNSQEPKILRPSFV